MQFWNELEGQLVDGLYPLRRLVRSEGRSAWFETEAENAGPATISLTESLTDAEEVAKRLQSAQRLAHPNLVAIRQVGRTRLENTVFVYAVMEHIDQSLSDIVREQALSKEEAREVAECLVAALTAVHRQGLVHGRVEPASVLAVGETVKLRSDCLQSPGGTLAGDVSGLGATLFQALTQRKAHAADDPHINRIPAPFAEIVRNSLSGRWTLAQVGAALKPPAPAPAAAAAPASAPLAAPPAAVSPARQKPPVEEPAGPGKPTLWLDDEDLAPRPTRPIAIYAWLAVLLILILGWLVFRPKARPKAAMHPKNGVSQAPAAAPQQAAPPPMVAAGSAMKPSPARPVSNPAQAETAPPPSTSAPVWRVIAYTYNHQDQAQRKADEIKRKHPGLRPSVVHPSDEGAHYLVAIGDPMDYSHAMALRAKAQSMGLPADTYARNFPQ